MTAELVVAAHPDDEVLGAGGTIARRAAEGVEVHVLILGEGATSRAPSRAEGDRTATQALVADAEAAGKVLGTTSVTVVGLPDNRFDGVELLDVVKHVEAQIERVRPSTVYTQHGGDVNVDHRRTFEAVLAATRPQPGHPVREVLGFAVNSSTEWAFGALAPVFTPQVFVDVSAVLATKLEALSCYEAELRPFPHPRSLEAVEAQARAWGSAAGVDAAEAFTVVRSIR
ncbi:MAG TPA: PIG-L deacetylase family protein [Acidimicrobiales bacterium]|nr:PIG-L deacetylase family protein [Acidimicrobiales bacterium]